MLLPALLVAPLALQADDLIQSPTDFDFLEGTWTMMKDGFHFTVRYEPILGGAGLRGSMILDDLNREVSSVVFAYEARNGRWTRDEYSVMGDRSGFVGVPCDDGIALEMVSFGDRTFDPTRSRLLFVDEGPDRFVLDWQNRPDADSPWVPRSVPFVHDRVERPAPPAGDGRIAFISNRSGNFEILSMAPDGSDVVNHSNHEAMEHEPRWTAGGSRIAFLSQRDAEGGAWNRWECDIDGTDLGRVMIPEGIGAKEAGAFPELHPSGSYMTFVREADGNADVFLARFDGGGAKAFFPSPARDARPLWSPQGDRVLFESERDGDPELYVGTADGKTLTRLTDSPGNDRYGRWSPDGAWIAFASERDVEGSLELYVMRADGTGVRRLTENDAEDGEPTWSPDGTRIAFRSNASGNPEVCVVDLASGEITNLTNDAGYDGEPVWSPAR